MLKLKHKELNVWKDSVDLVEVVYQLTESYPATERFGLVSQMRRAAVSIASNIAEGASRATRRERRRFYEIARSSLVELDTHFEISISLEFISSNELESIKELMNKVFARSTSLRNNA